MIEIYALFQSNAQNILTFEHKMKIIKVYLVLKYDESA